MHRNFFASMVLVLSGCAATSDAPTTEAKAACEGRAAPTGSMIVRRDQCDPTPTTESRERVRQQVEAMQEEQRRASAGKMKGQ